MERSIESKFFKKEDIISVPFPFSDLSDAKTRPALIVAESDKNNFIICPITSKAGRDNTIILEDKDFITGKLALSPCYIRVNILSTIDREIISKKIGDIKEKKLAEVIDKLIEILQKPASLPPKPKALKKKKKNNKNKK